MSEHEFWKDLGNIFDAVLNYQKKNVEFNNRFINPWIRLGNIFDREDQTNDAIQAYQHATEIDPDSVQNWVDLGDAQFKKGAYEEAIKAYGSAILLDPEAGWPLGNLALCLMTQGKIQESIPVYQKSIELLVDVKDKAICWNRLGNAYRKLNDYENAFLAFQKADQLDGENTGFNDTLDEMPPSTSIVAPEEILDQMIVEQTLEEDTAESTAPEDVTESVEEVPHLEVEAEISDISLMETANEPVALGPKMEMNIEEIVEKVLAQSFKEAGYEESAGDIQDDSLLSLHEKNFDIVQAVESVIAKIEQAFNEKENADAAKEQAVEEISREAEVMAVSEEPPQEIEATVVYAVSEQTAQETEPIVEAQEEVALEVESAKASEEIIQEIEAVAETSEGALEVETPIMSEEVSLEVEAVVEEIVQEAKSEVVVPIANEVSEEEHVGKDTPRAIPSWLVIQGAVKEFVVKAEAAEELPQAKSVTTLSDISREAVVSELVVNMDVVETYTDPLASQLTTEPSLSDESVHETIEQVEGGAEQEANVEAQDESATAETNPLEEVAVGEEFSTIIAEGQAAEAAYEEYLKDIVEPTITLTDRVDEIHSVVPVTKVSKNGEVRIVMDTKNAHVWNELGNIYLNSGACDDSIASYSKAIELDRNFAWPYSNLAMAYVQKGRFAEAILLYQRGIELFTSDKDKAITWNRLGNVYRRINDYSNAIASYQTADELDPENATLSLRSSFGLLGNMYSESKPAYIA